MEKSMTLGILFLSAMFLSSCSKSPKDKLVGEWEMRQDGEVATINFKSDGGKAEWKVTKEDKDSFEMKIYEDGEMEADLTVKFISDNEVELHSNENSDDEIMVLKRKKK